jgi:hypothetical protein
MLELLLTKVPNTKTPIMVTFQLATNGKPTQMGTTALALVLAKETAPCIQGFTWTLGYLYIGTQWQVNSDGQHSIGIGAG